MSKKEGQPPEQNTPELAGPGKHVIINFLLDRGDEERFEFDIVPDEMADFKLGFLGEGTPLAAAIAGQPAGKVIPYEQDDIRAVQILDVQPARSALPKEVKARREETIRKAVDASDRANAMIFASSFSGKWGDYDPTGFIEEEEDKPGKKKPE